MAYVQSVPIKFKSYSVVVGTPQIEDTMGFPFPLSVTASPGASGTVSVETSNTPFAAGNPGSAIWTAWPSGTVSTKTVDALKSPVTALRFTATTSTATVEVSS